MGVLFLLAMPFSPLVEVVPTHATAPALIVVGWMMMSVLSEREEVAADGRTVRTRGIDFSDIEVGIGAALTIMIMPFTFSITDGIGMGFLAFTVARTAQGRAKDVHPFMWIASAIFVLYFLVPFLQDTFDWI